MGHGMRLLVLGASGATGRLLVSAALGRGHEVAALVRDPARLAIGHPRLRICVGSALDAQTLGDAVAEQDAVLSVLGTRARTGRVEIYSAAARVVLSAMSAHGVRRLVVLSAAGVPTLDSPAVPWLFRLVVVPLLARREYDDMARMEALLVASDVDWTVLRPLWLRNGPALGDVRVSAQPFAPGRWGVRRADLAATMIDIAEQDTFARQGAWVGY